MLYLVPQLAETVTTISTQQIVTMLIGVIAPIVVGLITKASTSGAVKAILLATISVLVGIGQGFIDNPAGTTWQWQQAVFLGLTTWVVAVATYFGLWRPETSSGGSVAKTAQNLFITDKAA